MTRLDDRTTRLMKMAVAMSTTVALILISTKTWAYWSTGSLSLLGSLMDSVLDGMTSIINLFAVRYAIVPADHDHKYGHGKVESLAALGQSAFMIGSAVVLVLNSFNSLLDKREVVNTDAGIFVSVLAIILTLGLVSFQQYVIRQTKSVVIEADSLHYKGDLLMNLSVIVALALASVGWAWSDQVFAIGIAIFLMVSAWKVGNRAWEDLMDQQLPELELQVVELVDKLEGAQGCHDVRCRQSGPNQFIQLHLELDGAMTLTEAHAIGDQLERQIRERHPRADVIVHHDPTDK